MEHYNAELKKGMDGLNGNYNDDTILRVSASLTLEELVKEKAFPRYSDRYRYNR